MLVSRYYRPIGNGFLDACNKGAFWLTKEGLNTDFPDDKEIKEYIGDEVIAYCEQNNIDLDEIQIYR